MSAAIQSMQDDRAHPWRLQKQGRQPFLYRIRSELPVSWEQSR
jgi:hypothetical protein